MPKSNQMKRNNLCADPLLQVKKLKQTRFHRLKWILSLAIRPWIIFFPLMALTIFGLLLKFDLFFIVDSSTVESAYVEFQPVLIKQASIIKYISFSSIPYFTLNVIFDYIKDKRLSLFRTLIVSTSTFVMLCTVQFTNLFLLS